jgi:DNA-directed RNA polymerase specialized sigma subunit
MSMKLSSDRKHLVLDNQKLVYYLVQKLGVSQISPEYEDIISIGTIGLIKAAITFDSSKKITFAKSNIH